MTEEKPFITIDDVQIFVEDLPEEAQGVFGRVQRLNQKKVNLTLDLEEVQASLNFFSSKIVEIVNSNSPVTADEDKEGGEKEAVKSNN